MHVEKKIHVNIKAPAVVVGVAAGAEEETRVGADFRRWDTLVLLVLDCHQVA